MMFTRDVVPCDESQTRSANGVWREGGGGISPDSFCMSRLAAAAAAAAAADVYFTRCTLSAVCQIVCSRRLAALISVFI